MSSLHGGTANEDILVHLHVLVEIAQRVAAGYASMRERLGRSHAWPSTELWSASTNSSMETQSQKIYVSCSAALSYDGRYLMNRTALNATEQTDRLDNES
jgi:hypothetical protein